MNFIRESKMLFNADGKDVADNANAGNVNGQKSVLDPRCAFAHEYQNCVSVWVLSIHC